MLHPRYKQLRHDDFKLGVTHGWTMALPHQTAPMEEHRLGYFSQQQGIYSQQNERCQGKGKQECSLQRRWEKKVALAY